MLQRLPHEAIAALYGRAEIVTALPRRRRLPNYYFRLGPDMMRGEGWRFELSWDLLPPELRREGCSVFRKSIEARWDWLPHVEWQRERPAPTTTGHEPPTFHACMWTGRRRSIHSVYWSRSLWWWI